MNKYTRSRYFRINVLIARFCDQSDLVAEAFYLNLPVRDFVTKAVSLNSEIRGYGFAIIESMP